MISAMFSMEAWARSFRTDTRNQMLMLRVPAMMQAPQNSSHQGLMPPSIW